MEEPVTTDLVFNLCNKGSDGGVGKGQLISAASQTAHLLLGPVNHAILLPDHGWREFAVNVDVSLRLGGQPELLASLKRNKSRSIETFSSSSSDIVGLA